MQKTQIKAMGAIFDVDGTLLDSMPIWKDAANKWLRGIGVTPEENLGEILFRMSLDEGAAYLKKYYFSRKEEICEAEARTAEEQMSVSQIKTGVLGVIRRFYEEEVQAKPGVQDFLAHMKEAGVPMYLATSSDRRLVQSALRRLGLYNYFGGMITCEEAGAGKGDPQIFLMAAARMGLAATGVTSETVSDVAADDVSGAAADPTADMADVFVFEDVIHAVRAANSAGFTTVGVYDAASDADNAAMRKESSIYLHTLENWELFRAEAGL